MFDIENWDLLTSKKINSLCFYMEEEIIYKNLTENKNERDKANIL